jgi:hypothetical protein
MLSESATLQIGQCYSRGKKFVEALNHILLASRTPSPIGTNIYQDGNGDIKEFHEKSLLKQKFMYFLLRKNTC